MPKNKKNQQPTIEEVRTLREQAEGYIFDVISEFESISVLGFSFYSKFIKDDED